MNKLKNVIKFIIKYGINKAFRESWLRLSDNYYEKYFGVRTRNKRDDYDASLYDKESIQHGAVHYKSLFFLFNQVSEPKSESTILDYGCGKGRAIILTASHKYKKIIGVEYSEMIRLARTNLKVMNHRKTSNVELIAGDARHYIVPPEVNVIYFYNPFTGSILQKVIENIHTSFQNHPRKISIIYINNDHFERCIQGQSWIVNQKKGQLLPDLSYGLYEINN